MEARKNTLFPTVFHLVLEYSDSRLRVPCHWKMTSTPAGIFGPEALSGLSSVEDHCPGHRHTKIFSRWMIGFPHLRFGDERIAASFCPVACGWCSVGILVMKSSVYFPHSTCNHHDIVAFSRSSFKGFIKGCECFLFVRKFFTPQRRVSFGSFLHPLSQGMPKFGSRGFIFKKL